MADDGYVDYLDAEGRVAPLKINTYTLVERQRLRDNIELNLKRPLPRFVGRENFCQVKPGPIALVSSGPSLRETINDLRDFEVVMTCGSAHDFVAKAGIVPTYAVVSDAGKEDKGNLTLAHKDTTFLLASQCDPGLYEHLKDHKVEMWHYRGQATQSEEEEAELLKGEPSICWGCTVTLNSISLALMLGYQHLHFFGFDNNYEDYGLSSHCTQIAGGYEYEKMPVTVGPEKKMFITNLNLINQVNQFFRILEVDGRFFHVTLHGDGLTAEMIRQGESGLSEYVTLV